MKRLTLASNSPPSNSFLRLLGGIRTYYIRTYIIIVILTHCPTPHISTRVLLPILHGFSNLFWTRELYFRSSFFLQGWKFPSSWSWAVFCRIFTDFIPLFGRICDIVSPSLWRWLVLIKIFLDISGNFLKFVVFGLIIIAYSDVFKGKTSWGNNAHLTKLTEQSST